ncbi:unnamed protein product, partial [Cylicostephanus goldi]
ILAPFTDVFSEIHAYLYVFLCVVGVFANIAIVVVLLRPAMRRSPFNLFLICIAICDATLMATYLLYKHVSQQKSFPLYLYCFDHLDRTLDLSKLLLFSEIIVALPLCKEVTVGALPLKIYTEVKVKGSDKIKIENVDLCHPWFFSYPWMIYTKFYAMFSVFVHSASLWFTVNMAVMRYLVLYRGSRSQTRLPQCNSYAAAFIAIVIGAIIALIGSLPNMLRYNVVFRSQMHVPKYCLASKYHASWSEDSIIEVYDLKQPSWYNCAWERVNFWMAGKSAFLLDFLHSELLISKNLNIFPACVLKLIPCVLLTVFMTLLVLMLIEARERRSRLCGGLATGNSQAERTTAMLTGIVAVFLITELPQGILGLAVGTYYCDNLFIAYTVVVPQMLMKKVENSEI